MTDSLRESYTETNYKKEKEYLLAEGERKEKIKYAEKSDGLNPFLLFTQLLPWYSAVKPKTPIIIFINYGEILAPLILCL